MPGGRRPDGGMIERQETTTVNQNLPVDRDGGPVELAVAVGPTRTDPVGSIKRVDPEVERTGMLLALELWGASQPNLGVQTDEGMAKVIATA